MDEKALLEKLKEILKVCDEKLPVKCKKFAKTVQIPQAPRNSKREEFFF